MAAAGAIVIGYAWIAPLHQGDRPYTPYLVVGELRRVVLARASTLDHRSIDTVYVEQYRDWLTGWLSWFAIGRAIVSVGALGSWFAGIGHPEVWGGIIVASQVAEAVVNALPLSARQEDLSAFALALEAILIDALMEWEDIHSGEIGARDITRRRHALMRLRHETEAKHLPTGLPVKRKFSMLAEREAASYFESMRLRQEL